MSNTTETPAKVVKGSTSKKYMAAFFSDKNTRPYNDIQVYNEKKRQFVTIEGISEDEKIKEGTRPPYQVVPSFKKTLHEREEWKLVHSNKRLPGGWMSSNANGHSYAKHTLIVHLANKKKDPDFKTTYTFKDVKEPEIWQVLSLIIKLDRNNENDVHLNHVVKYHFAGKTVLGNGKKG